ncbi:hypothetical protein [Streptomyces sp. NPDC004286]|uniref:hypothetical protein n=1 Tax=Streptomyces sp. NPDC004286 TaxID=3364696 RepID=UPI00367B475F
MTPDGQDPVHLLVAEATVNELFVDEARFDGLLLRTIHRLGQGERGHTRVTYRMEITGTGANQLGPQIGPAITADWPETMAALVKLAQGLMGVSPGFLLWHATLRWQRDIAAALGP